MSLPCSINAATLASTLPGVSRVVARRYHIRGPLGRGGSKEVYLAYDERLDREVALALVLGAENGTVARARLEREARVTGETAEWVAEPDFQCLDLDTSTTVPSPWSTDIVSGMASASM